MGDILLEEELGCVWDAPITDCNDFNYIDDDCFILSATKDL